MTGKQKYWIKDVEGVYAQVEGADARDEWTKVRGWSESGEPEPEAQVHVVNENPGVGAARLPFASLEHWVGLGWVAGPPPGAVVESPEPADVEPAKPTKSPAAAGGDQKEK